LEDLIKEGLVVYYGKTKTWFGISTLNIKKLKEIGGYF
jgi:hypothetical protein